MLLVEKRSVYGETQTRMRKTVYEFRLSHVFKNNVHDRFSYPLPMIIVNFHVSSAEPN